MESELTSLLRAGHRRLVIQAPPGSGKTTFVPPLVANTVLQDSRPEVPAGNDGRILVTGPRRVSVRAAARRLAQLSGTTLGQSVGFAVKGEQRRSAETVVEFVTPGLLLRRLLADQELNGVAGVVLDEVHDRSLDGDLLLGMLAELADLRDDFILIAMSATLDAARFAELLTSDAGTQAPIVSSPAVIHRLTIDYRPYGGHRLDNYGVNRGYLDHVAEVTATSLEQELLRNPLGDALVFVPGAKEIALLAARLRERQDSTDWDVFELHGQLSSRAQDQALSGREVGGKPRIIIATNIAETSLTVPGVSLVVDTGLSRELRRDAQRAMSGLVTVSAPQSASVQRAGRAARTGPGRVVRCFEEKSFASAPKNSIPEIKAAHLDWAALALAAWGTPGGEGLRLLDSPPALSLASATSLLTSLGALAPETGKITDFGKLLSRTPTEPRLAAALIKAALNIPAREVAQGVAVLTTGIRAHDADIARSLVELQSSASSNGHPNAGEWAKESVRLERHLREVEREISGNSGSEAQQIQLASRAERLGYIVALAYPDWIARGVNEAGDYLLASGTRASLPKGSPLAGHEWLAIASVDRVQVGGHTQSSPNSVATGALIRAAVGIDTALAKAAGRELVFSKIDVNFSEGKLTAHSKETLGAIELSQTPVQAPPELAATAIASSLQEQGFSQLIWTSKAASLRSRLGFLHAHVGSPWPDVSDSALQVIVTDWLAPEIDQLAKRVPLQKLDLHSALLRLLPWPEASKLDHLAPEKFEVASGSQVSISYESSDEVVGKPRAIVRVKLQECFGYVNSPRIADGRAAILFELLSPAKRTLAVTDDLQSFWAGPYSDVRKEMRGKYPKHPWPEDPLTAVASSKVKRLLS